MRHWMNIGHCQFDLMLGGVAQQIIGKMVAYDEMGVTILKEDDGTEHCYAAGVVQHITLAP